MRDQVARLLFDLARSRLGGRLVRTFFCMVCPWLPVRRLVETDTLLAFFHPRPAYPLHIVIVSKGPIASLVDLQPDDKAFFPDLIHVVRQMVSELDLADQGYRLVINGGAYQEVPLLHAHLISETCPEPLPEASTRHTMQDQKVNSGAKG